MIEIIDCGCGTKSFTLFGVTSETLCKGCKTHKTADFNSTICIILQTLKICLKISNKFYLTKNGAYT